MRLSSITNQITPSPSPSGGPGEIQALREGLVYGGSTHFAFTWMIKPDNISLKLHSITLRKTEQVKYLDLSHGSKLAMRTPSLQLLPEQTPHPENYHQFDKDQVYTACETHPSVCNASWDTVIDAMVNELQSEEQPAWCVTPDDLIRRRAPLVYCRPWAMKPYL